MFNVLDNLKDFFGQKWVQVVQVVVLCVTVVSTLTGKVVDLGQVTTVVTQIGAVCLGIIWVIETLASAFGKKKE